MQTRDHRTSSRPSTSQGSGRIYGKQVLHLHRAGIMALNQGSEGGAHDLRFGRWLPRPDGGWQILRFHGLGRAAAEGTCALVDRSYRRFRFGVRLRAGDVSANLRSSRPSCASHLDALEGRRPSTLRHLGGVSYQPDVVGILKLKCLRSPMTASANPSIASTIPLAAT